MSPTHVLDPYTCTAKRGVRCAPSALTRASWGLPFQQMGLAYHSANLLGDYIYGAKLAMQIHHFVTMALILGSDYGGFQRIGVLVMFVHDVPDIFSMSTRSMFLFVSCGCGSRRGVARPCAGHARSHVPSAGAGSPSFFLSLSCRCHWMAAPHCSLVHWPLYLVALLPTVRPLLRTWLGIGRDAATAFCAVPATALPSLFLTFPVYGSPSHLLLASASPSPLPAH